MKKDLLADAVVNQSIKDICNTERNYKKGNESISGLTVAKSNHIYTVPSLRLNIIVAFLLPSLLSPCIDSLVIALFS